MGLKFPILHGFGQNIFQHLHASLSGQFLLVEPRLQKAVEPYANPGPARPAIPKELPDTYAVEGPCLVVMLNVDSEFGQSRSGQHFLFGEALAVVRPLPLNLSPFLLLYEKPCFASFIEKIDHVTIVSLGAVSRRRD